MSEFFDRLLRDRSGATAIEYALLGSLVAVTAIIGINALGGSITSLWDYLQSNLGPALGSAG